MVQCDGGLTKSYRSRVTITPTDAFMRLCVFQLQQFSGGRVKWETLRTATDPAEHQSAARPACTPPLQPKTKLYRLLRPQFPSVCGWRAPDPQERCYSKSLIPQLGVFSLFKISVLGVYTGLSAGSFHPSVLELFTARRLQPVRGGDGRRSQGKRGSETHRLFKCVRSSYSFLRVCLYVCWESRACVVCFFLFGLIKAFGLSIRRDVCSIQSGVLVTFHFHCWPSVVVHGELSG